MKQAYQGLIGFGLMLSSMTYASTDQAVQQDPLLSVDQPFSQYPRTLAQDENERVSTAVQQDPLLVLPSDTTTKFNSLPPATRPASRSEGRPPATRSSSIQEDPLMQNLPTP